MKNLKILHCVVAGFALLLLVACGGGSTNSTAPNGSTGQSPLTTQTPFQPAEQGGPVQEQTSGSLWVRLFAAEDSVVDTPEFLLQGQAPAETVITVNDEILVVPSDQNFSVQIPLEEGPNLIEVVASNLEEDTVSFELTVTYEPAP